jgi:hypothetical protein
LDAIRKAGGICTLNRYLPYKVIVNGGWICDKPAQKRKLIIDRIDGAAMTFTGYQKIV